MSEQQDEHGESGDIDQEHGSIGGSELDEPCEQFSIEATVCHQSKLLNGFGSQQDDDIKEDGGGLSRNGSDGGSGDSQPGKRSTAEDQDVVESDIEQGCGDVDPHDDGGAATSGEEARECTGEQEGEAAEAEDLEVACFEDLDVRVVSGPGEDRVGQWSAQCEQQSGEQRDVDGLPE